MFKKIKDNFNLLVFGIAKERQDERVESEMNKLKAKTFDIVILIFIINHLMGEFEEIYVDKFNPLMFLVIIVFYFMACRIGVGALSLINYGKKKKMIYKSVLVFIGLLLVPIIEIKKHSKTEEFDIIFIIMGILIGVIYVLKLTRKDVDEIL